MKFECFGSFTVSLVASGSSRMEHHILDGHHLHMPLMALIRIAEMKHSNTTVCHACSTKGLHEIIVTFFCHCCFIPPFNVVNWCQRDEFLFGWVQFGLEGVVMMMVPTEGVEGKESAVLCIQIAKTLKRTTLWWKLGHVTTLIACWQQKSTGPTLGKMHVSSGRNDPLWLFWNLEATKKTVIKKVTVACRYHHCWIRPKYEGASPMFV